MTVPFDEASSPGRYTLRCRTLDSHRGFPERIGLCSLEGHALITTWPQKPG